MSTSPAPPYLVVREAKAFWVEACPRGESVPTLQAFEEGCYRDAWGYDASGTRRPILAASLKGEPSFWDRHLPWRRVVVQLEFGAQTPIGLPEVVSSLAKVLRSDNEFCEYLPSPPLELLRRFEGARSPSDIIWIAREID